MYMLIASVDPLIVYYHDGFLRVSLTVYDKNSNDVKFPSGVVSYYCIEISSFPKHTPCKRNIRQGQCWRKDSRNERNRAKRLSNVDNGRPTRLPNQNSINTLDLSKINYIIGKNKEHNLA